MIFQTLGKQAFWTEKLKILQRGCVRGNAGLLQNYEYLRDSFPVEICDHDIGVYFRQLFHPSIHGLRTVSSVTLFLCF